MKKLSFILFVLVFGGLLSAVLPAKGATIFPEDIFFIDEETFEQNVLDNPPAFMVRFQVGNTASSAPEHSEVIINANGGDNYFYGQHDWDASNSIQVVHDQAGNIQTFPAVSLENGEDDPAPFWGFNTIYVKLVGQAAMPPGMEGASLTDISINSVDVPDMHSSIHTGPSYLQINLNEVSPEIQLDAVFDKGQLAHGSADSYVEIYGSNMVSVPEPSSVALFTLISFLVFVRRRRG
jgi:hypothetical protein